MANRPNLSEREQRLATFLESLFPGIAVRPSLYRHGEAREQSVVRLPEVRLSLDRIEAIGLLRWRLEFAESNLGENGIPLRVEALRDAISEELSPVVYRPIGGGHLHGGEGAFLWEEFLEEAWSPAGEAPQALFVYAEEFASSPLSAVPAATSEFSGLTVEGPLPGAGEAVAIASEGFPPQYLGRLEEETPQLVTEFRTVREYPAGAALYRLHEGIIWNQAARERETRDPEQWRRNHRSLAAVPLASRIATPVYTLELEFPLLGPGKIREYMEFLRSHGDHPAFLLARSDLSLAEAVPKASAARTRWSLIAGFDARELEDLEGFQEVSP